MPDEPLVLRIKRDGLEDLSFSNPDELDKWNEDERAFWVWLGKVPILSATIARVHSEFGSSIGAYVRNWRDSSGDRHGNQVRLEKTFQEIEDSFTRFTASWGIFKGSPEANFIEEIRIKYHEMRAGGAYAGLVSIEVRTYDSINTTFLHGIQDAHDFMLGSKQTGENYEKVLNTLKTAYSKELSEQQESARGRSADFSKIQDAFVEYSRKAASDQKDTETGRVDQFAKLLTSCNEKWRTLETTYDKQLALQKPVRYWADKQKKHTRQAWIWGVLSSVAGVAAAVGFGYFVFWMLSQLKPNEAPKSWQFGLLFTAVFFVVWFLRLLVRLFLSNHHLATDADERRLMILTYLAMSRQGEKLEAKDRELILQHIFRSASDGLVKDDAAPPLLAELLSRK